MENNLEQIEQWKLMVRNSLERRRQAIVYLLAQKFLESMGGAPGLEKAKTVDDGRWSRIESLSQLRAAVGGRFQNLKTKWVEAGFPLREHRGDREGKAAVDPSGWAELVIWIGKQGFEARLASPEDPWLFEVRKA